MNRMFLVCIRRVQMHSTNKMILLTLVLYSCLLGLSQCQVNVALNKPAYQQNPFKTNYSMGDASNAVDGQKSNLTRNSGHCVLSAGTETATLWVNLTSTHNIENVTIYFMTDNKQYVSSFFNKSSFLGFSVYVSNTTDRLQGTQCYTDTNFTLYTIPAVFTAVCSLLGQYVIYYNERLFDKAYPENYYHLTNNNLCEIEVYGCPATGCYGSNNSLPCPDVNCQQCHKQTGTCQVCKPGYKGQQCKLECETGTYGVNCSKSCGNCLKQRQCQNVDGFCSKGCSAGYKGSLCTEPCKQTFHGINCSQKCNTNCRNQDCHHVTGKCIDSSKVLYSLSIHIHPRH